MSGEPAGSEPRAYFERVMTGWGPQQAERHPYADNPAWQRHVRALRAWITARGLATGRVLEVGCGTGLLQDLVPAYVGIDLAASSGRFLSRPFAVASATRLPFPDGAFDGLWSFWVLEHVAEPEQMLAEFRRVLKPGGSFFLVAAYGVGAWVSRGLHRRPWAELSVGQRLERLTIPVRASRWFRVVTTLPRRLVELARYGLRPGPTPLRYGRLQPNFDVYWDYDADACVALDSYSVALYFLSRGDRPCFPAGPIRSLGQRSQAQAYVVGDAG